MNIDDYLFKQYCLRHKSGLFIWQIRIDPDSSFTFELVPDHEDAIYTNYNRWAHLYSWTSVRLPNTLDVYQVDDGNLIPYQMNTRLIYLGIYDFLNNDVQAIRSEFMCSRIDFANFDLLLEYNTERYFVLCYFDNQIREQLKLDNIQFNAFVLEKIPGLYYDDSAIISKGDECYWFVSNNYNDLVEFKLMSSIPMKIIDREKYSG